MTNDIPSAGLVYGDQLIAVNGRPLVDLNLAGWVGEWGSPSLPRGRIRLTVRRAGSTIELPVPTGARETVEAMFPQVQLFLCANRRGQGTTVSYYRRSENQAFLRAGEGRWRGVAKDRTARFSLGIFAGRADLRAGLPLTRRTHFVGGYGIFLHELISDRGLADSWNDRIASALFWGGYLEGGVGTPMIGSSRLTVTGQVGFAGPGLLLGASVAPSVRISDGTYLGLFGEVAGVIDFTPPDRGVLFVGGGVEMDALERGAFVRLGYMRSMENLPFAADQPDGEAGGAVLLSIGLRRRR